MTPYTISDKLLALTRLAMLLMFFKPVIIAVFPVSKCVSLDNDPSASLSPINPADSPLIFNGANTF